MDINELLETYLGEKIDKQYQWKVLRSDDDGKTWDYTEGDTYDSMEAAKRVKTNMLKAKGIGKKVKIERIKRTKLSGPKSKLP